MWNNKKEEIRIIKIEDIESVKYLFLQIEQVTKQGIKLIGHLTIKDDIKFVEIYKYDEEDDIEWPVTIQFTLSNKNEPIFIKSIKNPYYLRRELPKKMFIDMINYQVIIKSENHSLYLQLTSLDENINSSDISLQSIVLEN